jgi:hypothetical protein
VQHGRTGGDPIRSGGTCPDPHARHAVERVHDPRDDAEQPVRRALRHRREEEALRVDREQQDARELHGVQHAMPAAGIMPQRRSRSSVGRKSVGVSLWPTPDMKHTYTSKPQNQTQTHTQTNTRDSKQTQTHTRTARRKARRQDATQNGSAGRVSTDGVECAVLTAM